MTSALVQRMRNDVAPRLLAKFGNGGVFARIRVVTPNPDPLMPPSETFTNVEFNASVRGVESSILTADTNLTATDLQVICAAIDYIPTVDSQVEVNGSVRAVVRVDAIPAGGPPAIYRFFLR